MNVSVQKNLNLIDLVKSFPTYTAQYLVTKIGVDRAENEPLKINLIFKFSKPIFAELPRQE